MSRELDRQRREREFHGATHALDWRRAEQLAVAALQDRDRPRPNGNAWRKRRDVAHRGIAPRLSKRYRRRRRFGVDSASGEPNGCP